VNEAGCKMLVLDPGWVQTDMGGTSAEVTVEKSCSGLLSVFQTAMVVQTKSHDISVPSSYKAVQEALSTSPSVYVSYRGRIIPW
jgi:hypothetical protein